jgi:hypothetical protein
VGGSRCDEEKMKVRDEMRNPRRGTEQQRLVTLVPTDNDNMSEVRRMSVKRD